MKPVALPLMILSAFLWNACKKEDLTPGVTPEIEVVGISPATVREFQDSILLTLSYKDGDGDLGENAQGVENLFVKDTRNGVVFPYRIRQLAPDNATIAIQGNLTVTINSTTINGTATSQSVTYEIYVTDRAGHVSNTVTTPALTVVK